MLVDVGAEQKGDRLVSSRTVVCDVPAVTWRRPESGDEGVAGVRRRLVAATWMHPSGAGGGDSKTSDGSLPAFDCADRAFVPVVTDDGEPGRTKGCLRISANVAHADRVLLGQNLRVRDEKTGRNCTRIDSTTAPRTGTRCSTPAARPTAAARDGCTTRSAGRSVR